MFYWSKLHSIKNYIKNCQRLFIQSFIQNSLQRANVSGATTATENITGNSFIMVVNEVLYYGNKLDHSLINLNQLRCYGMMVWDNPFDENRDLCLETYEGDTCDLIPDDTNIGFSSHVLTEEDIRTVLHIKVTSGSECNPNTVKLCKVYTRNNSDEFHSQQCTFGYPTMERSDYLYLDNGIDEDVPHSTQLALVKMVTKLKCNISEIVTPSADEIPERRTFISHMRHLKASAGLIADRSIETPSNTWCHYSKRSQIIHTAVVTDI